MKNKGQKSQRFFEYNFFPKNHKGSHIGVMISFVIFIMFVFFISFLLRPSLDSGESKRPLAEEISREIVENASLELSSATISITSSVGTNCVSISSFTSNLDFNDNIVVRDGGGNVVESSIISNTLNINRENTNDNFFRIYSSEGLPDSSSTSFSCTAIVEGTDYNFGLTTRKDYVFESELLDIINLYSDYDEFKEYLGITPGFEAGVLLVYNNGTIVSTPEGEATTNIYSKETYIEYVDENANIQNGVLRVRIW